MTNARVGVTVSSTLAVALTATACAKFGYTDRVLHRVPSPDGQLFAVCQAIPEVDGPGDDVCLERADGSLVARLYQIGDGDPCHEVVWSPDGRLVAVFSAHVARIRFVDVRKALARTTDDAAVVLAADRSRA